VGSWGWGYGAWAPTPNPQSPIPNPQSPIFLKKIKKDNHHLKIFNILINI